MSEPAKTKTAPARGARDRTDAILTWGGTALFVLGTLTAFLLMANVDRVWRGPIWGMLAIGVAALGALGMTRVLRREQGVSDAKPLRESTWNAFSDEPPIFAPKYAVPAAVTVAIAIRIAFDGKYEIPAAVVAALALLFPAALRRPMLLVFVVATFLYLPMLGAYGLWDPWETHYGEVAREILMRDDWISLWWAQENWFWSKPILIFWSEALSMGAFGVDYRPDANPIDPEFAVRFPHYLMSTGAVLAVYAAIARAFGARAGVCSAIVLATIPHFFLIAHQAITDMPFVANMTIAMALLVMAVNEDPERRVKGWRIGPVVFTAQHALILAVIVLVLPQALYLVSRNITWVEGGFAWHRDIFTWGSPGNGDVPGNTPLRDEEPYLNGIVAQPAIQGLIWLLGLGGIVALLWREKRVQSLTMFGFYVFCALSFMGKGIPGFALPGAVALFYLFASGRWSLLWNGNLRIAAGALTVATIGLPWFVAMYIRHGPGFTDRLLVHDHINRLASGVHGDTGSIEYFLEQLGPAMFPWVALVPAALTAWLHLRRTPGAPPETETERRQRETLTFVAVWFATSFTLFNAMITKFHHYIFPVVPPVAVLVGVLVSRMLGNTELIPRWRQWLATALGVLASVPLVLGVGAFRGNLRGIVPEGIPAQRAKDWVLDHGLGAGAGTALVLLGLLLAVGAWVLLHYDFAEKKVTTDLDEALPPGQREHGKWALGATLAAGVGVVAFVGRDLSWVTAARPAGYERLIQLFIYNYGRPWPEYIDYRPILTGFAIVAGVVFGAAVFRVARPVATRVLIGLALFFATWSLDLYLIDLAPHWGQRELLKAYYEARNGPDEPVLAWQMNWKGENFYTGNRVYVFVDLDNTKVRQWIEQNRGRRVFFMCEHSRLPGLRSLLGNRPVTPITDERLDNKFLVVETRL